MLSDMKNDESKKSAVVEFLKRDDRVLDEALKKYTHFACLLLKVPMCFVSVMDDEKQYLKAAQNVSVTETCLQDAFCVHTVAAGSTLICEDTLQHDLFKVFRPVREAPFIRFYAGCPLKTQEGVCVGTLCLLDTHPRQFTAHQIDIFENIAALVAAFLETWLAVGYIDIVTLLPNRQRLLRDIPSFSTHPFKLVVIDCIDVSFAYEIARSLGTELVENLLKDMASQLKSRLNVSGQLYCVATGRFAFLTEQSATLTLEVVSASLRGVEARMDSEIALNLDIHIGDSGLCTLALTPNEILRRGVSALHDSISHKRTVMAYSEEADDRKKADFLLLTALRKAVQEDKGLYLVYQPKLSLNTRELAGVEALLRWRHPEMGEILPGVFIPLVEKTSLMSELTDWVIAKAVDQLGMWQEKGVDVAVSINLAAGDFSRPGFADMLSLKMRASKLNPSLLGIECLETEKMLESETAMAGLALLKQRGFRIYLDDFGSGYSNINYLRQMPLDVIKLDRSLVSGMAGDYATKVIVRNVITLLKELDYVVLAEGVEDEATVELLQALGCDQIQGYAYSKPLRAKKFEDWYRSKS